MSNQDPFRGLTDFEVSVEVETWSEVDALVRWLCKDFAAQVVQTAEGPDARTILLRLRQGELTIFQWDTGDVTVRASSNGMQEYLRAIAAKCAKG